MSPITTHILDTSRGKPAQGVQVTLSLRDTDGGYRELARGKTDDDGRVRDLLPKDFMTVKGVYRLHFATGEYFLGYGAMGFYPEVVITFELASPGEHYHVPLLLNPFGYSTYRGS